MTARTIAWFGVAVGTQPNAPLDLIEWLSWGFQSEWGYPKHPPLTAWMAGWVAHLCPGDVWAVYLLSYLHAAACLWAAWQVGREFLSPRLALLGAVCLDGLSYLTGDIAEFNNNVSLDLAWALVILFFIRAVRCGGLRWWLALGAAAGLGLLCKYTLIVVLVPLAACLCANRRARAHLRTPGPYLAVLLAATLFSPHAAWMVRNDFVTLSYASDRSLPPNGWSDHLKHPALFLVGQLVRLAPVLVVLSPVLRRGRGVAPVPDRELLHWAVLGPVALLLALSVLSGRQLRDIWGSPLWTFVGVWAVATAGSTAPVETRRCVAAWAGVAAVMLALSVSRNVATPHVIGKPLRIHYPGRQLSQELSRRWAEHCDGPFPIVAGEAWRAGNVCCYTAHRPMIYSSGAMGYLVFEPRHCPWTSDADLVARGGVILWDAESLGEELPVMIRDRFPGAHSQPAIVLPYCTSAPLRPDRVGVAFVWPAGVPRHARDTTAGRNESKGSQLFRHVAGACHSRFFRF